MGASVVELDYDEKVRLLGNAVARATLALLPLLAREAEPAVTSRKCAAGCGTSLDGRRADAIYCSDSCRAVAAKARGAA